MSISGPVIDDAPSPELAFRVLLAKDPATFFSPVFPLCLFPFPLIEHSSRSLSICRSCPTIRTFPSFIFFSIQKLLLHVLPALVRRVHSLIVCLFILSYIERLQLLSCLKSISYSLHNHILAACTNTVEPPVLLPYFYPFSHVQLLIMHLPSFAVTPMNFMVILSNIPIPSRHVSHPPTVAKQIKVTKA